MAYSSVKLYKKNKENKSFVIIYYRHDGAAIRQRTGVAVLQKNFDNKASKIKPSEPSYESYNEIVSNAHKLMEEIIVEFIKENGVKPTSEFVKTQLKTDRKIKKETLEANLLGCYQDFLNYKKIQFTSPEKSITSLRDYKSTQNALIDYSQIIGSCQPLDLKNKLWLEKFNNFLASPRPKIKGYKFKTSTQNDKTRSKRFGVLKNFGEWLIEEKFLNDIDALKKFKVKVQTKSYFTLNLENLKSIQEHKFESQPQQKAIDMFLVACHTGVRFGDIIRISKARIKKHNDTTILTLNNQKTKERIDVPLSKKVLEILEKYDYNLKLMSSQKTNHYIHNALKNIDVFLEDYEYGIEGDTLPKYKLVTFHTGRRTFITNLVNNNVNLNAIMKMTGHKKISTLQQYINPDYDLIMDNIKIFNDL